MARKLPLIIFFLLVTASVSLSQNQGNPVDKAQPRPLAEVTEETENQEINKDEGYGDNDQEYYGAEGTNSADNAAPDNIQLNQSL